MTGDTYSDKRVKRNISETPYGLQEVLQLQPVIYDHHSAEFEGENGLVIDDEDFNRELGFIAQEVYEILPEMVCKPEDENSGPMVAKLYQADTCSYKGHPGTTGRDPNPIC